MASSQRYLVNDLCFDWAGTGSCSNKGLKLLVGWIETKKRKTKTQETRAKKDLWGM